MPIYFIRSAQVDQGHIIIRDQLTHHLRDVLRVEEGEILSLVDEQPKRYAARLIESSRSQLVLEIVREESPPPPLLPALHLGVGLLKGEKMEWVIQKATELGVARLTPLMTERAVVRPKSDRIAHQQERWLKIVTEAAQQSGRWTVPKLDPPMAFKDFLAESRGNGLKFFFWEGAPPTSPQAEIASALKAFPKEGTLLIGPEGGWEKKEVDAAAEAGYRLLSLGSRVLRAETAVLAALAIVQYEIESRG
ncbi:MAG: 16S rRNA (uracil(1498)-N(3))-methyltransferase [Nitrospirae bacterium]|nr:16S rRNA (uracil(1498)-N(3))-methyltransferase [Candidatus Manganitrophaceae bacterium]